jgi:prevent-host-death family protein
MRGVIPMSDLHAQIITKNGRGEYAILPYKEFLKIQEQLEDYEDLRCLREAKQAEKDAPTIGISELKKKKTARQTCRK